MTAEEYYILPTEVQNILDSWDESGELYQESRRIKNELESIGYTCEYGLCGEPYDIRKL